MKGKKHLLLQSPFLKYEMEFSRNITILRGDSATGKTTLVEMVQEFVQNGSDTGIQLSCDCPCRVVSGNTWQEQLEHIEDSIVFVDEGNRFVSSEDFARTIQHTGNYYVIITRENLDNLPYSVSEIYGIRSSGKYGSLAPVYHEMYRIYLPDEPQKLQRTGVIITEDSNAGYDFFHNLADSKGMKCLSANGAGSFLGKMSEINPDLQMTIVADGAAFGAQIGRVYPAAVRRGNTQLYLPESFEWLILVSDVLDDTEIRKILSSPEEYIESSDYFSWEQFFTRLLIDKTQDTYLKYLKSELNPAFLKGKVLEKLKKALPGIFSA